MINYDSLIASVMGGIVCVGEIDNSQEVNDNSDIDIESDGEVYQ